MLSERELRAVVNEAMVKYALTSGGAKGWAKADIEESVTRLGGNKDDLYRAMAFGMELCFGDLIDADSLLN